MTDKRLMAVDHGNKRLGVALTDPFGLFASPTAILDGREHAAAMNVLRRLIDEKDVRKVIVGLPTATDGGVGKQATIVIQWARSLAKHVDVPVVLWDESYTSERAQELARENRRKPDDPIDDLAAAAILQDYVQAGGSATHEPGQTLDAFRDVR